MTCQGFLINCLLQGNISNHISSIKITKTNTQKNKTDMYLVYTQTHTQIHSWVRIRTFYGEVHALADVGAHVVADFAQVVAAVFLQHVFDQQRAFLQQLHPGARVQGNRLKLRNSSAWDQRGGQQMFSILKTFYY